MVRLAPDAGVIAVGSLAGFGGGLLVAALIIAVKPVPQPAGAVVPPASTVVSTVTQSAPPPQTVTQPAAEPAPATVTVTATKVVTETVVAPQLPVQQSGSPGSPRAVPEGDRP